MQIIRRLTSHSTVFGIQPHNFMGKQTTYRHKARRQQKPQKQIQIISPSHTFLILRPHILRCHNACRRGHRTQYHCVNGRKFPTKTDACDAFAPKLSDHELIHHGKRRLQQGLQRNRQCNANQLPSERIFPLRAFLYISPSPFTHLPLSPSGCLTLPPGRLPLPP